MSAILSSTRRACSLCWYFQVGLYGNRGPPVASRKRINVRSRLPVIGMLQRDLERAHED